MTDHWMLQALETARAEARADATAAERNRLAEIVSRHVTGTRFGIPALMREINHPEEHHE